MNGEGWTGVKGVEREAKRKNEANRNREREGGGETGTQQKRSNNATKA